MAAAKFRIAPIVDEALGDGLGEIGQLAVIREISVLVASEDGVRRVMECVVPLRVGAPSEFGGRPYHANVIEVALRDQMGLATEPGGLAMEPIAHLRDQM